MTTPTPIPTIPEPDTSTTTSTFKCPCTPSHSFISDCPHSQTHLSHEQALRVLDVHAKEKYLIKQFCSVFDGLTGKVQELEKKLVEDTEDSFQEKVLRAVLAYVREIMAVNELVLEEARRALWDGFGIREGDSEGLSSNDGEAQGGGETEGNVEAEKEWEVIHEQYFNPNFC